MAEFAEMVTQDYELKRNQLQNKKPQANVIHKRIHQMLDNIIRSSNKINLDDKNPRVELHQLQCMQSYQTIQQ